eukprot:m.113611 g.113611  ORF g.113611 m.113611 type:complete len:108 (-) comp28283_c4_seq1:578-901(-)
MSINTCEYAGPRGKCVKPTEVNGKYCDRHRCPCENCFNSKSSSDPTCGCGGVIGRTTSGPEMVIDKAATMYGATIAQDVAEYDRKRREAALERQRKREAQQKDNSDL